MTYGLGTLYLTTISIRNQSVYVLPSDFASIGDTFRLAVGIIHQDNVVRDMRVVSEMLQPLPGNFILHIHICMYMQ